MNKRIPILLGIILVLFAVWLQITSIESVRLLITRLNNLAYDMQLRTTVYTRTDALNSNVAIIDIDDKSLAALGRWPWPRAKLAELVQRLQSLGVAVIALDMMFPEKETDITESIQQELFKRNLASPLIERTLKKIQPDLDNDKQLAESFINKDIVLGITFLQKNEKSGLLPNPIFELTDSHMQQLNFIQAKGFISNIHNIQAAAKNGGFINVYADPDGIIRRVPLLIRYQNNLYPSLAFEAVKLFLFSNIKLHTADYNQMQELESVQLGTHIIPVDSMGNMLIPFRGKSFTYPYFSALDVIQGKIPDNVLTGKIAFIGTSATGVGDLRATAVQGAFPGVEIQATIADSILQDRYSYRPAWTTGAEICLTIILGVILVLLYPYLGPRSLLILSFLIPLILVFLNDLLWQRTGLVIFVLIPTLLIIMLAIVNTIYGYIFETRRRERLKEMFGQYVPKKHIDEMLKATGSYGLHGEDREMTVLFADIRNFTTISEPMQATDLKEMLNQFFTPMTEIIFNHQGTIDKYIGDLIMAFWGAPLKDKKHAQHALSAALDMQAMVEKLKPIFAEKGWPEIEIGIGLNSGIMSVGDMGSQFRRNYTVIGDAVNLSSRIEGLTKFYGVKIMTTEFTQSEQKKFVFRQLDRVTVKGKKQGVAIYEVVCYQEHLTESLKQELEESQLALALYFKQEWREAERRFQNLHEQHPDVKLYSLYLERIAQFKQHPPQAQWDGIYSHASK
jgi:adenylate cyclase